MEDAGYEGVEDSDFHLDRCFLWGLYEFKFVLSQVSY